MRLFVINSTKIFFHGSMVELPVGTILTPRNQAYEDDWGLLCGIGKIQTIVTQKCCFHG
jgi:hypothetical protein